MSQTLLSNFTPAQKDLGLLILAGLVILLSIILIQLRIKLIKEKHRRITPYLNIDINADHAQMYLHNIGDCPAKNISVADMQIGLGYGFTKQIRIEFDPIDDIPPKEKIPLTFRVFDREHQIPNSESRQMIASLSTPDFTASLTYSNLQGIRFIAVIAKEKGSLRVKEITPVN